MEKHFSHHHNLTRHQLPSVTAEIKCSGCKLPGSGVIVYGCWQCNFFLHEQCYQVNRALNHPSHPAHPLTFLPIPTYPSGEFRCHICNLGGSGFCYTCANCEFDLHVHCAHSQGSYPYPQSSTGLFPASPPFSAVSCGNLSDPAQLQSIQTMAISMVHQSGGTSSMPSKQQEPGGITHFSHSHRLEFSETEESEETICACCEKKMADGWSYSCSEANCNFHIHTACFGLPRTVQHKSHTTHPLTLLPSPDSPTSGSSRSCFACHKTITGFVYNCSACNFYLHIACALLPTTKSHKIHDHPLTLFYKSPLKPGTAGFVCDICREYIDMERWMYYCSKQCDYGAHPHCWTSESTALQKETTTKIKTDPCDSSDEHVDFGLGL